LNKNTTTIFYMLYSDEKITFVIDDENGASHLAMRASFHRIKYGDDENEKHRF